MSKHLSIFFMVSVVLAVSVHAFAAEPNAASADQGTSQSAGSTTPFSIGIGFRASTLGLGGEAAVPIVHRANVRVGFNLFNYSNTFSTHGISYDGAFDLRSVQGQLDFFPFAGSFHLSPGVMFWDGNNINARAAVPGGQTFKLDQVTFLSSPADPVTGTGTMTLAQAGPMFTIGWGNLVPRKPGKHFSFSFEGGFVYQGTPNVKLNFTGTACNANGTNCQSAATNPIFQTNLLREQQRLSDNATPFRFYPILSTGIGYRF